MIKLPIKKELVSESIKYPLIFLLIILTIFYIYTFFHPIPTPVSSETIGIGADQLAIGDRNFYLIDKGNSYGYEISEDNKYLRPSFFYPFIINNLKFIISKFGLPTIAWNFAVIFLASLCSITSLFLIDKSTNIIFDQKTATISSWIFVLSPYTIFYTLSGGITIYMALGVSFFTYLILKSTIFNSSNQAMKIPSNIICLFLNVLFLSSIRPTGSIFSITVIIALGITIFFKYKQKILKLRKKDKLFIYIFFTLSLAYSFYQIKINLDYLSFTYNNFTSEVGTFFGLERQFIREKINSYALEDFNYIKSYFFLFLWKVIDFVSGLSDIRDTFTTEPYALLGNKLAPKDLTELFPFIARVFNGFFIMYPINLFAFLGIFIYWKRIFYFGLWISLSASLLCLSPNLLGVASSRYLIMVYPPFIIISAKVFGLLIHEFHKQLSVKNS